MPIAKGHLVKAGFKKAATWGTPVAVGAGDGIYLLSEGIKPSVPRIDDRSVGDGQAQMRGADISGEAHNGTITCPARYEGRWLTMLASMLGIAGAPSGPVSGAYTHRLKVATDISDIFGTLCIDKQVSVWEMDSCMVKSVTLRSTAGTGDQARLSVEFGFVARQLNLDSVVNTTVTMEDLTFPVDARHLLHHHLTIRMNANEDGALGAPDVLKVRTFELKFENKLADTLFYSGSRFIDIPDRNDFVEVTGSFLIDKYTTNERGFNEFRDGTYMKADAEWNAGDTSIFRVELPYIQITGGDRDVPGPGLIQAPIPWKAYRPAEAPTGMDATESCEVVIVNTESADYLA